MRSLAERIKSKFELEMNDKGYAFVGNEPLFQSTLGAIVIDENQMFDGVDSLRDITKQNVIEHYKETDYIITDDAYDINGVKMENTVALYTQIVQYLKSSRP